MSGTRLWNGLCRLLQGQWRRRFHFRTAKDRSESLARLGLDVEAAPMGDGTPFANVMFCARRRTAV